MTVNTINSEKIQRWSKPASTTEEQKCDNALGMIKDAISTCEELKQLDFKLVPQGSYHNNTNVRTTSDVDICVKLYSTFYSNLDAADEKARGFVTSSLTYDHYKQLIWSALRKKFGDSATKGKKCFKINSNHYRVDADVVPCMEYRHYNGIKSSYESGVQFFDKSGNKIINFPEQHYTNGVKKNNLTNRKYKRIVRILKRCKYQLIEQGDKRVKNISSFGIECAIYNVANYYFAADSLEQAVENVLASLYARTKQESPCHNWTEVNEILPLFTDDRAFTADDINYFAAKAYELLTTN